MRPIKGMHTWFAIWKLTPLEGKSLTDPTRGSLTVLLNPFLRLYEQCKQTSSSPGDEYESIQTLHCLV